MKTLTRKERVALIRHWSVPIRVRGEWVEAKKGPCWGRLCTLNDAKLNAQIIITRSETKGETQ